MSAAAADQILHDFTKLTLHDADIHPELEETTRVKQSVYDEYEKRAEGGLSYLPHQMIEEQRTLIWAFVKQVGKHMLMGGSLTQVSLPIGLSEPKSLLQRIAMEFCYAPVYMHQAAEAKDPVERMKHVVTFIIAGLHRQCIGQKKPFNPILGETYQASFFDGTRCFMEQTSHHPPCSNWDLEAPGKWRFWGYGEATANVAGNAVKCGRKGRNVIDFADGARIVYTTPTLCVGGLVYGTRTMEYLGEMEFEDAKNGIHASIKFDAEAQRGWFSSTPGATDVLKGSISRMNGKTKTQVHEISGSWIDSVSFDGQKAWDIRANPGYELIPDANPLPSDCSFREDLRALADGDVEEAQKQKERLEQLQRADRKCRAAGGKHKGGKH